MAIGSYWLPEGSVNNLRALPTLSELIEDPARASELPPDVAKALLVKVAGLEVVLLTSAVAAPSQPNANGGDRFLDPREVGAIIGKSKSWVEKNTEELPK